MKKLFISICQVGVTRFIRLIHFVYGDYVVRGTIPNFDKNEQYIFASNHQSRIDPFVIFGALSIGENLKFVPMRFMTAYSIYHSFLKLLLICCGCYPTRIKNVDIIDYSAQFIQEGYNLCIFPEGRRTLREDSTPHSGICRIIAKTMRKSPSLILVHIEWQRRGILRRRYATIAFSRASPKIDTTKPKSIMDAIYSL